MLACLLTLVMVLIACTPVLAEEEDAVLAVINGENVLQSQVDEFANQIISYYSQYGYDLSSEDNQSLVRQMAMESYIQKVFTTQESARLGLDQLTDEESQALSDTIESVYEGLIDQAMTAFGLTPAEDASEEDKAAARDSAIEQLNAVGYTREFIERNETEGLLSEKLVAKLTENVSITDDEIIAAFTERAEADREQYENDIEAYEIQTAYYGQESYYVPEGLRGVKHILLRVDDTLMKTYQDLVARFEEQQEEALNASEETATTETEQAETTEAPETTEEPEEPVTQEQIDAAKEAIIASVQDKITDIQKKLSEGVSFADLIEEYGEDPGMTTEPNKTNGYTVSANSLIYDPIFVQAAFSVDNVGDVSEPVVSSFGVHLVEYTRDVPYGTVDLTDEIRAAIEEDLRADKEQAIVNEAYTAWEAASEIQYTEAGEAYRPEPVENADDAQPIAEEAD